MSAVVVDLPLVPVMATKGALGTLRRRSRQNSSMSPMTSMPASAAFRTVQCGSGWVSGTPGERTRAANFFQSALARSATGMPAASASATDWALSSNATTSAPPATSAAAVTRPLPPRPKTATRFPEKLVTGIMVSGSSRSRDR